MIGVKYLKKMWCSVGEGFYKISSTQQPNYLVIPSPTQHHSYLSNYVELFQIFRVETKPSYTGLNNYATLIEN